MVEVGYRKEQEQVRQVRALPRERERESTNGLAYRVLIGVSGLRRNIGTGAPGLSPAQREREIKS